MREKMKTDKNIEQPQNLCLYTCSTSICVDLGILLELGSIGAGHAATSLSEVLQQQVLIDVPKIHNLPVHQLQKFYHRHDTPTSAVYMQLSEESECDILLMFETEEAKKIATIMTMASSPNELEPSMIQSAIQELANILVGSFLSAISDFTSVKLLPAPPQLLEDTFDAIIDNFLIKQAMASNQALLFDTSFRTADSSSNAVLIIFPSPRLQKLLVQKSKDLCGNIALEDEHERSTQVDLEFGILENATEDAEEKNILSEHDVRRIREG